MRITVPGKDIIKITEADFENNEVVNTQDKIHLIKLAFETPTEEKMDWVLKTYPNTKRFVVENDIKFYNDILKQTDKKYYVENSNHTSLITFFRKNNKILLNFLKLLKEEKDFILNYLLSDILRNVEIIMIDEDNFNKFYSHFKNWKGNIIIQNDYKL